MSGKPTNRPIGAQFSRVEDNGDYGAGYMSSDPMDALTSGMCPVCNVVLYSRDIEPLGFNCPNCHTLLVPSRGRAYFLSRLLFTFGGAAGWAWYRWHDSFGFFAIPFYAIPLLFVWLAVERRYFPTRKFEPHPRSPFITIGI